MKSEKWADCILLPVKESWFEVGKWQGVFFRAPTASGNQEKLEGIFPVREKSGD